MIPIKFRGKNLDTGEYVFSETIMQEENYLYRGTKAVWFGGEKKNYPVDAESVSQLIGYDPDGEEIFEGDKLMDSDGLEHFAQLGSMLDGQFYRIGETIPYRRKKK